MERLRQAEAEALKAKPEADASDAGLGAMRAAIAATEEAALMQLIAKDEAADGMRLPNPSGQSSPVLVAKGGGTKRHRHRASRAVSRGRQVAWCRRVRLVYARRDVGQAGAMTCT